jgi:hypothetical protein
VTVLAFDDDGGPGLGSRLEFISPNTETLLIRVERYNQVAGVYRLEVSGVNGPD